jgi:hypothetical protein
MMLPALFNSKQRDMLLQLICIEGSAPRPIENEWKLPDIEQGK